MSAINSNTTLGKRPRASSIEELGLATWARTSEDSPDTTQDKTNELAVALVHQEPKPLPRDKAQELFRHCSFRRRGSKINESLKEIFAQYVLPCLQWPGEMGAFHGAFPWSRYKDMSCILQRDTFNFDELDSFQLNARRDFGSVRNLTCPINSRIELLPLARRFPCLTDLDIQGAKVQDLRPLTLFFYLRRLNLDNIGLQGADLYVLAHLPSLVDLYIGNNTIGDEALIYLLHCKDLKSLGLRGTGINGSGFIYLKHLESLEYLALEDNVLSPPHIATLAECSTLTSLSLMDTDLDSSSFFHLAKLPLTSLDLSENGLHEGENFHHLAPLGPSLTNLDLSFNQEEDPPMDLGLLSPFIALHKLNLRCTRCTNFVALQKLTSLTQLNVSETSFRKANLRDLSGLDRLRSLTIIHIKKSDRLIQKIRNILPKLHYVHFGLSGEKDTVALWRQSRAGPSLIPL